jgi:enoyl-CoA hydratase/carnithine racemase
VSDAPVLVERRGPILEITLNRPDNRNSMTPETLPAFREAIASARSAEDARCVIITGTGTSFSAGADFKSSLLHDGPADGDLQYEVYAPFLEVLDIEVPVIAAMQGHAVGGGLGLALMCDLRIANQDAKYGANFTRLGLAPGMALSYVIPRLVGVARGMELMLTGTLIDGTTAAEIGLVNRAVPGDDVLPTARALAEAVSEAAPVAVRITKQLVYRHLEWDPRAAARREAPLQAQTADMEDFREGVASLLEKRTPRFTGT